MTEGEAIGALTDIADTAATYVGIWITLTFAYLTVSYFVGKSLSRFQCMTVSGLYLLSGAMFAVTTLVHTRAWLLLRERQNSVYDDVAAATLPGWMEIATLFFILGMIISLYFMYNVRRTNKD